MIRIDFFTRDKSNVIIDDTDYGRGDIRITEGREGFDASVHKIEVSKKVASQSFNDILKQFSSIYLKTSYGFFPQSYITSEHVSVYIDDTVKISFLFTFDINNWKYLWSTKEYIDEFKRIILSDKRLAARWGSKKGGLNIYPKLSFTFPVEDVNATVNAEILKYKPVIRKLHELTESSLESKLGNSDVEQIIRSIEFPPEYYHSGITILSYFADVLRHKNLSEQVKVAIEQNGLNVRLVIESPTGQRELVERTLETYAMVVTGKQPIDTLTTDPYEVIELKNQLRVASVQIETQREMIALRSSEVTHLRSEVEDTKTALKRIEQKADNDTARLMSLIEGLIEHNSDLSSGLRELAEQGVKFQNRRLANALESLHKMVERGLQEQDQKEAIKNLKIIQREDIGVFRQVSEILVKGAVSGAAGNYLYAWLQFIVGSLPK